LFQLEQHPYESEIEYRERLLARTATQAQIESAGMTTGEFLAQLQNASRPVKEPQRDLDAD
jgi:hypothetical protein